jgi:hypothetical protein
MSSDTERDGPRAMPVGARSRTYLERDQEIPVSLERLLLAAARDPELRQAVLADREAALAARGIELRQSELDMLSAMPEPVLRATLDRLDPSRQRDKHFARAVAAAVAGTMLFTASCVTPVAGGIDPGPVDGGADADGDGEDDAE